MTTNPTPTNAHEPGTHTGQVEADAVADEDKTEEDIWDEIEAEEAAHAATDTDDPLPDDNPEPEPGPDAGPGGESEEPTDSPSPEALAAENAALKAELDRRSKISRGQDRKISTLMTEVEQLKEAQTKAAESRTDRTERLKELSEEYPDIVAPLAEEVSDVNARFDSLAARDAQMLQAKEAELNNALRDEWGAFTARRPDGMKLVSDNADVFNQWIEDQPKQLRDIHQANMQNVVDGEAVADLVDAFEAALTAAREPEPAPEEGLPDTQPQPKGGTARRKRQLASAQTVRTGRTQMTRSTAPSNEDATEDDWWDFYEQEDKQAAQQRPA